MLTHNLPETKGSIDQNFYFQLNEMLLRWKNDEMKDWLGYLYYLITAIKKEEPKETIAYREIPSHHQDIIKKHFVMGRSIRWSGFSSETTSNLRDKDKSILLRLKVINVIIIGEPHKKVLLLPNMIFRVTNIILNEENNVGDVDLEEDFKKELSEAFDINKNSEKQKEEVQQFFNLNSQNLKHLHKLSPTLQNDYPTFPKVDISQDVWRKFKSVLDEEIKNDLKMSKVTSSVNDLKEKLEKSQDTPSADTSKENLEKSQDTSSADLKESSKKKLIDAVNFLNKNKELQFKEKVIQFLENNYEDIKYLYPEKTPWKKKLPKKIEVKDWVDGRPEIEKDWKMIFKSLTKKNT